MSHRSTAEPLDYPLVVVPTYVFVYRLPEFRKAAEFLFVSVVHLLLQLGEEVLRLGVVQAVALPRHRLYDSVGLQRCLVSRHLVLPPLVRMQDHVVSQRMLCAEVRQHGLDQRHVRALRQRIAEYLVVVEVDHRREVGLAPLELEFRHVRPCLPQAGVRMEVPLQQVRRRLSDAAPVGTVVLPVSGELGVDAQPVHQPENLLVVCLLSIPCPQLCRYLPVSVAPLRAQPYRLYLQRQTLVLGRLGP